MEFCHIKWNFVILTHTDYQFTLFLFTIYMSGRYTSLNPKVKRDLKNKNCVSWFNSKPAKRPGDGLEPLKYNCEESKKRSTSPTNKGTKKLRVSPIVVPPEMKNKNKKTKKGGRKLRKYKTKRNKKSKKGVMKKMRMKAGTKKSLTSL